MVILVRPISIEMSIGTSSRLSRFSPASLALLRRIVAELGGLDLVVYASGVNFPPGLESYKFNSDQEMLEVNLVGAFAWLNPVAAMFQAAGAGTIVGISSVAGDRGRVGNPAYNASKAGIATYLEALRNRLTASMKQVRALFLDATARIND